MTIALQSPNLISALVPVDNAPVGAVLKNDFAKYIKAMTKIQEENVTKQIEADEILKSYEEVSLLLDIFITVAELIASESSDSTIPIDKPCSSARLRQFAV